MSPHYIRLLSGLFLTMTLVGVPGLAIAQEPREENMALKNYEKAKQAYGAGDFELAADLLQKAYAEDPDLIYQYNRIRALQAMGSYDEALKTIDLFGGPMSRDKAQRFTDLDELEAQIRAEKIEFDRTKKPDVKEPDVKEPDVKEPDTRKPDVKEPIEPPVVEEDNSGTKRTIGWVLLGTGVASIAGTSPFWSGILIKQEECFGIDKKPAGDICLTNTEGKGDPYREKLQRHKIIGGVGIGVGAAAGITGIVLVLMNGKKSEDETGVSVAPLISPDRAGATMTIRF